MSRELDYRNYVNTYFLGGKADVTKPVDLGAVALALGLHSNTIDQFGRLGIPEFNFRAAISQAIGKVEEDHHDVTKNENNTRVKLVPEANVPLHTRLQEDLYQFLTPIDQAGAKE